MKNVTLENMTINNDKLVIGLGAPYQDINNTLVNSYYIGDKEYSCKSDMSVNADSQQLHQIIEIPYKAND